MAELLLELFSEEIPARMQQRAAEDLQRLMTAGLKEAGLETGAAEAWATPRRLALVIHNLPSKSPAISEERKGPRVGAPDKAIAGFLRGAGLTSIDQADIIPHPKKGDFYVARIEKPGRPAAEIIAEVIPAVCNKFPWPKSMRWGHGSFNWVRPLHSVLCILDGKVVPFRIGDVESGNTTRGHRFHGTKTLKVKNFEDYCAKLEDNKVIVSSSERAAAIAEQAEALASEASLELVQDNALTFENAGLTEWPTVLMGTFEEEFLDVPAECLITSMKSHQKCFSLHNPETGNLANKFLAVTNLIAADSGEQIVAGNEKVIRARLSDAKFFWQTDLKRSLDDMARGLDKVTFHEKLGSQKKRVERIAELAAHLARDVDAPVEHARRAAQLCKADLMSEMVGEFPELQGLMGRYYAQSAGTRDEISQAVEEHYKPKGSGDDVPTEPVSISVALADKLDTLVGFWAIGEKPTGSGDPYQLRRAALGVIRICLENDLRLKLGSSIACALELFYEQGRNIVQADDIYDDKSNTPEEMRADAVKCVKDNLLSFFADRLKVHLRDEGVRHDLIDAVFALDGQDDIALVVKRVEALSEFLKTEDGENLLAGTKRAANILAIEEKKDGKSYNGLPDGKLLSAPPERALEAAIAKVKFDTKAAIDVENFKGAMRALAELRAPVDQFFEDVKVNDEVPEIRENRLKMLAEIRSATRSVADFSKIAG